MLVEFRVENHRSLRDEQVLTMESGRVGNANDPVPRRVAGHNHPLLPVAVIYGANASGKSNVLSALGFMATAVSASHQFWHPGGGIPRSAFAWGQGRSLPTSLEASFIVKNVRYVYGFSVSDHCVEEEWLYAWPIGRKQVWFERDKHQFNFGEYLKGPNESVQEVTRNNALFLSTAAQHNHDALTVIYQWFDNMNLENVSASKDDIRPPKHFGPDRFIDDGSRESTLSLLKIADTGIADIRVEERVAWNGLARLRHIQLKHQIADENSWLDLDEESEGTKTLLNLATPIARSLEAGNVLVIDELESSLHPRIGQTLVQLFNDPQTNPHNAQLLFTTHDTNLLGTTLGEPALRRDQIWFTEKDREGATSLYPLTDYKPRKAENLERGYLQGRYGAIPFVGDITRITE